MIDEVGRIVDVGSSESVPTPPSARQVNWPNAVLLPGWVNLHTHLELTGLRGKVPETDFFAWIQHVRAVKEGMTAGGFFDAAREGVRETWRHGTTTVADTGTSGAAVAVLTDLGGRGVYYQEAIAPDPELCDETVRTLMAHVDTLRNQASDSVRVGVSPHAPYTVSPQLYTAVGEFARSEGLPLAAHLAESQAEVDLVTRDRGPFSDMWRERGIPPVPPARTPVEYVGRLGLLGRDLLAIHGVRADGDDVALLGDQDVAIAVCPRSNLRHGHGSPPLATFIEQGLRLGLGTDSAASVDSLDVRLEARMARDLTGLSAEDAIRILTLGGATALGLEGEIGSLDRGKWADICVMELAGVDRHAREQVAHAVLEADSSAISTTLVGGRFVFQRSDEE